MDELLDKNEILNQINFLLFYKYVQSMNVTCTEYNGKLEYTNSSTGTDNAWFLPLNISCSGLTQKLCDYFKENNVNKIYADQLIKNKEKSSLKFQYQKVLLQNFPNVYLLLLLLEIRWIRKGKKFEKNKILIYFYIHYIN